MKKAMIIAAVIGTVIPMAAFSADIDAAAFGVHIRSLAASCAACHGTQGNAVPAGVGQETTSALAGVSRTDIVQKLQAFKSGERTATVMHRHAKGLTPDEITGLAEYFSMQQPKQAISLQPQKLRADHAN